MLKGILPAIPTIFDSDGRPNLSDQRSVVRFALSCGAAGIVFPGVASECAELSETERQNLLEVVTEEVDGRIPIVVGASASDSGTSVRIGQHARELGLNHFMIMAASHLGLDVEAHQKFFGEIAAALPECEIMLQNAPSPIGAGLGPQAVCQVANAIPNIRYIKEETLPSGPRITWLVENRPETVRGILGGGGSRYIIDELNRGAIGAIPAVELLDLHVALFDAHKNGQNATSRELYRQSLPLLVAQMIYRMRLTKYVLCRRGVCDSDFVRADLPELDVKAKEDIDQMLAEIQHVLVAHKS